MMSDAWLIVLAGFLGGAHCVGMCGGFPVMIAQLSPNAGTRWIRMGLYGAGKTLSYMALGLLIGGGGAALHLLMGQQQILSVILGGLLVVAGGAYVIGRGGFTGGKLVSRVTGWLSGTLRRWFNRGGAAGAFGIGVANGLLPCPLVYAMLLKAGAAATPLQGAATLGLFGVGTLPALFAMAWVGQFLQPYWRQQLDRVTGILLIVLGVLTILRGLGGPMHSGH